MEFLDLNRHFAPIDKDQEVRLDTGRVWGSKVAGWLDWPELLKRRRVVLLAEASCGKTEEFRHQQERLADEGHAAFFVRIEDLADHGLDVSLGRNEATALGAWKVGSAEGYFFLDSVDEARLNRKRFETALLRLARDLADHLGRTHFFISCRVSDWRGRSDRDAIARHLPVPPPVPPPTPEPEVALLSPIFERKEKSKEDSNASAKPDDFLVVQLVPLDTDQHRALARAAKIDDPEAFIVAIAQHGIDMFAERPGDLLDLIDYWREYGRFGSLTEMTEYAISRKLSEIDKDRPDNNILSATRARKGVERIAAALTLGQTFTVKVPAQDIDPTLAAGALDPDHILHEFKDSERNALLRRPCFAPSTYGRIRFHHRGTQEVLAASWFDGLLLAGWPKNEVWPLFFADCYGAKTVIPSMRSVAAWLALKHMDFMDEVIRREPLVLIQYGDPGSVPLPAKKKLLGVYASRHAAGEISDDHMDHRAIWMFARPELADAIRQAWGANTRQDFRRDLLRMVQEAKISACTDLARNAFNDPQSKEYTRIRSLAALAACEEVESLMGAAAHIVQNPETYSSRLASKFSILLFPKYLTTSQLLRIIEKCQRPQRDSLDDFSSDLEDHYRACPDDAAKDEFLLGLAELALRRPFSQDYKRVSRDYEKIADNLAPIAHMALEVMPEKQAPLPSLVRTLMAVERADRDKSHEERTALSALVRSRPMLNRTLFWADVDEVRGAETDPNIPNHYLHVHFGGHCLWGFSEVDLSWLKEDITGRKNNDDQRIALSATVAILLAAGKLDASLPELRAKISGLSVLEEYLETYLAPRSLSPAVTEFQNRMAEHHRKSAEETEQAKESWRKFREDLNANPGRLSDPVRLATWPGVSDLKHLSRWLQGHTGQSYIKHAVLYWQEIATAFSQDVANAYHDGMIRLWRLVPPERPKRKEGNAISTKWANTLAFAAIGIEATRSPDWSSQLSAEEAAIAARHACLCEEGYPDWMDALLATHPEAVLPIIRRTLEAEWVEPTDRPGDLIYHLAHTGGFIPQVLKQSLIQIVTGIDTPNTRTAELGVRILQRTGLDERTSSRVERTAVARLESTPHDDPVRVLLSLAVLFLVNADEAIRRLSAWIDIAPKGHRKARAESALARLFGRNHAAVSGVLPALSTPILSALARFTYIHISPLDDVQHEGAYSPDTRDDAEGARNAIITALLDRPGEEAYLIVKDLADAGIAGISRTRFRELARGKAERDSKFPPWQSGQVVDMEIRHTAPIRAPDDLMRVTLSILEDIKHDFTHADASSREVVCNATNENEVQNWLAEQLRLRANGRFHVHREPEVADKKEPDITISAIGALIELAIEVKHGGKGWTVSQLEVALRLQLVENYLRTGTRRRGILVITGHGNKTWREPTSNFSLSFEAVIQRLQALSETLTSNATGTIRAVVVGIDASPTKVCIRGDRRGGCATWVFGRFLGQFFAPAPLGDAVRLAER